MSPNVLNTVSGTFETSAIGRRDFDDLLDRIDDNFEKVNEFAGQVSGSFSVLFVTSGSAADKIGSDLGSAYTREDAVIREVVVWASTSGSGGVSRIDVDVQQGPGGNFSSIYSNNAFKPALSASLGNYGIARGNTFISGSNMRWPAGTLIKAQLETAAGATGLSAQNNICVQVFYTPSGSYGA